MKRPKTFWSARDELHNLRFFPKYTEKRFQQFEVACLNVRITVAEVVNSVDYESASYMSSYI